MHVAILPVQVHFVLWPRNGIRCQLGLPVVMGDIMYTSYTLIAIQLIMISSVNFSTFARKGSKLLHHNVARLYFLQLVQCHVVQIQLVYFTTICGISSARLIAVEVLYMY